MPRPRKLDRPVEKTLCLRTSIVEQVDASLRDPITGKPAVGSWASLTEELLQLWLDRKVKTSFEPFNNDLTQLIGDSHG